ncbi:MAG: hypothetical protein KA436_02080 [Oligoflexales bacterium]|nr:hypothetical protein [Oligoflexales bacterium]
MPIAYSRSNRFTSVCFVCIALLSLPETGFSLFFDGTGHYSLKTEVQTAPSSSKDRGMHSATEQSFRLEGEARVHDKSSFFLELRLFDKPRDAYLGDESREPNQNTSFPAYKDFTLKASKAYMRYAFDYCILEAGRRGRDWGLGLLLDSGKRPFSQFNSVFDGVTCDVNTQKFQTLGFLFGFDQLSETGSATPNSVTPDEHWGPSNLSDDIQQFFFAINYDDRKVSSPLSWSKEIAIYAANIKSKYIHTDLSFVDLYSDFASSQLRFKNEFIFRLGKTGDLNSARLGGAYEAQGEEAVNKMQTIALAGNVEWTFQGTNDKSQSTSWRKFGDSSYPRQSSTRHLFLADYTYAPGDSDGYYADKKGDPLIGIQNRDSSTAALALHPNYKPALILFNGRSESDDLRVDGVFESNQVVNSQIYSLGYRYESSSSGTLESKLLYALLNGSIPDKAKAYYADQNNKPIGFYGQDLGFELDVRYWIPLSDDTLFGASAGALFPGSAWRRTAEDNRSTNILFQAFVNFDL